MSGHLSHNAMHGLHHAMEHDGVEGAVGGAVGVAAGTAATLATIGYALTPLGWATAIGVGAYLGGKGILKKLKG
jgi:hypothetical protein